MAVLLGLLLVVAWQKDMLDPYSWLQVNSTGIVPEYTPETLFAAFPLVVEGTLAAKGEGVTPRLGDDPVGVPYDLYELHVTHVWSGPEGTDNLPLAFRKDAAGVSSEGAAQVRPGEEYVFFLSPKPREAGIWEGLYPMGVEELMWRPVGGRIVPTAPQFEEMTRPEFAAFIQAESAKLE
ncbi:MAG: hypothetical protein WD645_06515 [Dehalococcoidia bacterium]